MSDKHHSFLDGLKGLVVDIDETPDPVTHATSTAIPLTPAASAPAPFTFSFGNTTAAVAPVPATAAPVSLSSFVNSAVPAGPEAEEFYQKLLDKTNFDASEIAVTIQRFVVPLQGLITDRQMLFKAAVATAKSQANVSEDAILAVFDSLKASLSQAEESFKTKAAAFEAKEITARTQRLTDIQNQLASLQTEQQQVANELSDAQSLLVHIPASTRLFSVVRQKLMPKSFSTLRC